MINTITPNNLPAVMVYNRLLRHV